MLSTSLVEAKSNSRCLENEARGSVSRMARAETEKDVARHDALMARYDALMARLDADAAGNARAKVESELARVQSAMATVEEARRKADDDISRLTDERVSLLLELVTCKDEISAIWVEALRENEALREAYKGGLDVIFNYGYGCCAFAHNICGSQPEVPDRMPDTSKPLSPKFFINPRCPLDIVPAEAASTDVLPDEETNAPEREAPIIVPETGNSKAGEHPSAVEVGSGKEPTFS